MNIIKDLCKNCGINIDEVITVHDNRLYEQVLKKGSLGLGESYMRGWWDSIIPLNDLFNQIAKSKLNSKINNSYINKIKILYCYILGYFGYLYNNKKSKEMAEHHYDIGNELYKYMLGNYMVYSCGYYDSDNDDIDKAQLNKMHMCANKLKLEQNMRVLEIGCGWGELSYLLASEYGVKVDAITISEEQYSFCLKNKYHPNINYHIIDYRDYSPLYKYDRIVSVGMFEHVGYSNYRDFFTITNQWLNDEGLFLLHTICGNESKLIGDSWINKYIFPNSSIPSMLQITKNVEKIYIIEDVHNFGTHYAKTLLSWYNNFIKYFDKINQERVINHKKEFDDTFKRMWSYYLLSCSGYFQTRDLQLVQVILSKGISKGYQRSNLSKFEELYRD